jgi:hypothetical protein
MMVHVFLVFQRLLPFFSAAPSVFMELAFCFGVLFYIFMAGVGRVLSVAVCIQAFAFDSDHLFSTYLFRQNLETNMVPWHTQTD